MGPEDGQALPTEDNGENPGRNCCCPDQGHSHFTNEAASMSSPCTLIILLYIIIWAIAWILIEFAVDFREFLFYQLGSLFLSAMRADKFGHRFGRPPSPASIDRTGIESALGQHLLNFVNLAVLVGIGRP